MKLILFVILVLMTASCQEQKPDIKECDQLARHTYKGLPKAAARYKKYCMKMNLSWSPERCKEVFQKVVLRTPKKTLDHLYGEEFMECFSDNDIEKFGAYLTE